MLIRRALALTAVLTASSLAAAGSAHAALPVPWSILAGVQKAAVAPNSSPAGSNDFACKPSAQHPEPVVLVHGLGATMTTNWQTMSPFLKNAGYCVFALTYGQGAGKPYLGGVKPMERSAVELKSFVVKVLAATGAKKVDLVGHSEGSTMPHYYIRFLGGAAFVDRYVGLTPLYGGTSLAGLGELREAAEAYGFGPLVNLLVDKGLNPICGSCEEFLHGSKFNAKMAARGWLDPGVTYTNIVTRDDELVVPYTSGEKVAPNSTNIVVQNVCPIDFSEHLAVAADPVVAQLILNGLDPATAKQPPCRLVLPFVGGSVL